MRRVLLAACAALLFALAPTGAAQIIDNRNGSPLTQQALVEILAGQQYILLGELHDNPQHHQLRGDLIRALQAYRPNVVAEHLERDHQVTADGDLLDALTAAGFDAKSWRWPLHQPLFQAITTSGLTLVGGNIPRAMARDAVRNGESALPQELRQTIAQAPLDAAAQAAQDDDLQNGHCGQLPAAMLPGLRLAQRARDAAMFLTLQHWQQGDTPAILLAGNGHVRRDYGIPSLIRHYQPDARQVSIGFVEEGKTLPGSDQFDYLWVTAAPERTDPCAAMQRQ